MMMTWISKDKEKEENTMKNTTSEKVGKFYVYLERNEFGIDGRINTEHDWVCDGSEPKFEKIESSTPRKRQRNSSNNLTSRLSLMR